MNNKTYYHLIFDRSGSMAGCREHTIRAYTAQIDAIRQAAEQLQDRICKDFF